MRNSVEEDIALYRTILDGLVDNYICSPLQMSRVTRDFAADPKGHEDLMSFLRSYLRIQAQGLHRSATSQPQRSSDTK